jgi:glycosyltransferase involved in cell wall biosynthesis
MKNQTAMTQPKILYISRSRIPSDQANCVQVLKMCAGFAAHAEVELAAPYFREDARRKDELAERFALARSFPVRWLPFPHIGDRFAVRGFALAAASYARVQGYRLAYTRDPWAAYWLARSGIRTGFEAHDLKEDRRYPIWQRLVSDRSLSPALRGVFCITRRLLADSAAAGARAEILHVAPDGVDLQRFQNPISKAEARKKLGLPVEGLWIVHAGHLYEGRGGEELVQALGQIPGARLLFAGGKSADVERVRAVAAECGLADRVRFEGMVPNGRIPLYLWAADVLVMPYTSRTPIIASISPMKMFEYMAAGRPIVSTDFPTLREVLRDGENAVLTAPDSPAALAAGIRRTADDPAIAEKISRQARRDVEQYTWERRAEKILGVLTG